MHAEPMDNPINQNKQHLETIRTSGTQPIARANLLVGVNMEGYFYTAVYGFELKKQP